MTRRAFLVGSGVLAAVGAVAGLGLGRLPGLMGFALGLSSCALNLAGMWGLAQALTPGGTWTPVRRLGLVALFGHLPAFFWAAQTAQRSGGTGPAWFVAGGALVYCLAVGWVLTRPR